MDLSWATMTEITPAWYGWWSASQRQECRISAAKLVFLVRWIWSHKYSRRKIINSDQPSIDYYYSMQTVVLVCQTSEIYHQLMDFTYWGVCFSPRCRFVGIHYFWDEESRQSNKRILFDGSVCLNYLRAYLHLTRPLRALLATRELVIPCRRSMFPQGCCRRFL